MRLFGKRSKEKEKDEVLLGEPLKVRLPEDPVPQVAEDPALPADIVGGSDLEPAVQPGGQSMEALLRENEALKREIADLKSRIAYARSVLLADVEVPEAYRASPHTPQQDPAMTAMDTMAAAAGTAMGTMAPQMQASGMAAPQPGMGMDGLMASPAPQPQPADDIRAMLAELKQDIASIQREVSQPATTGMVAMGAAGLMGAMGTAAAPTAQPAEDIRAMLAELKQDIASIQREVAQPAPASMAAAPASQPADDIRAMLAELKQDIASIRREVPQPAAAPVVQPPAEDLRAMLAELKQDIAAIRREEPVVQRRQDDDLREMLARLKADIDSLKKEKEEPVRKAAEETPPVPENGVHRLLEELQQGVAELSLGGQETMATPEERPVETSLNGNPLLDLPEREGRAPLFGGGQVQSRSEPTGSEEEKDETSKVDKAATSEDEISSRIESLLAELHNELRQASGREFLKEKDGAAHESVSSEPSFDEEEPRRAALH